MDTFTHLLLPTVALILISFAGYTRYTRASMLEVLNQDYIRTARSKGLTERTVIMRHAFRNALLPLASIVPVDIITLIGGAVITETVFDWSGMGRLFVDSLAATRQDPVMAYILIVGIFAVLANFVADLCTPSSTRGSGWRDETRDVPPEISFCGGTPHEHASWSPPVGRSTPSRTPSSSRRSRGSRKARSSGVGSSGTAARSAGSGPDLHHVLLAYTSIGAFGIPGWWKWDHTRAADVAEQAAPRPSACRRGWAATGFAIGDHPFGQDELGQDTFARTMKGDPDLAQRDVRDRPRGGLLIGMTVGVAGGLLPWLGRPAADADDRPLHHVPDPRHRRRPRQARRATAARSCWRSVWARSPGRPWPGSSAASSSPCASGSSSTPPRWRAPAASGSCASTCCPTRWASSSSTRRC